MTTFTAPSWSRRRWLRVTALAGLGAGAATLTACGGGDSATASLSADRSVYFVGDRATLRAEFDAGQARIEPGIGPVRSGELVLTPVLDRPVSYRLIVQRAGQPDQVLSLALDVRFRNRWVAAEQAFPVAGQASVADALGGLLVVGGQRNLFAPSADVDRFDPATRRFVRIGALLTGRVQASATLLADGRVLVVGGTQALPDAPQWELFDPALGRTVASGLLAAPRNGHSATRLRDGRVLVAGGTGRDSAELFDPQTQTWRLLASRLQHPREGHSATLLGDGQVLIVGGHGAATGYHFAERFDPAAERFASLADAPAEQRLMHAALPQADGTIAIVGGEQLVGEDIVPYATTWRFDPAGARFVAGPALPQARTLAAATRAADGQVLLFGGAPADAPPTDAALAWTPQGVRALAPMPAPRAWADAHRLPDGRILVYGGLDALGQLVTQPAIYE